jgi:hypothetical protein
VHVGRPVLEAAGGSAASQPRPAVLLGGVPHLSAPPRAPRRRQHHGRDARTRNSSTARPQLHAHTRRRPSSRRSRTLRHSVAAILRCETHGSPFTASGDRGLARARPDPNDPAGAGTSSTTEKTQEAQFCGQRHSRLPRSPYLPLLHHPDHPAAGPWHTINKVSPARPPLVPAHLSRVLLPVWLRRLAAYLPAHRRFFLPTALSPPRPRQPRPPACPCRIVLSILTNGSSTALSHPQLTTRNLDNAVRRTRQRQHAPASVHLDRGRTLCQ